jgi:hypothetical protein
LVIAGRNHNHQRACAVWIELHICIVDLVVPGEDFVARYKRSAHDHDFAALHSVVSNRDSLKNTSFIAGIDQTAASVAGDSP